MGFLLLQYEYQRANRQVNTLQRTGIRINNQVARYTKRIEKMQSVFSKAQSRLETKYNNLTNQFNSALSSASASTTPASMNAALAGIVIAGVPLSSYITVSGNNIDTTTTEGKQQMLQMLTNAAAQAKSIMATLIESAKEADTEKLEAQQDEQLQPISEKESDLEAEQSTNDVLCTLWEQRRDAAKEKLPDAIQNSMGHYGIK